MSFVFNLDILNYTMSCGNWIVIIHTSWTWMHLVGFFCSRFSQKHLEYSRLGLSDFVFLPEKKSIDMIWYLRLLL